MNAAFQGLRVPVQAQVMESSGAWAAMLTGMARLCAGLAADVTAGALTAADVAQALPRVGTAPRHMTSSIVAPLLSHLDQAGLLWPGDTAPLCTADHDGP